MSQLSDVTEQLVQIAQKHIESRESPWGGEAPSIAIDEMQAGQLRALGYGVE